MIQDSRSRLLDAAEELFGQRGLQASVRDITRNAKTNLAAVNYHFGSKEALIDAVLTRRAAPVNAERLRLLDELESAEGPIEVEAVLRAFLDPAIELQEKYPQFMQFAGRVATDPAVEVRQIMAARFGEVARRFHAALCRGLTHLDPVEVWVRLGFLLGSVTYTWTNRGDLVRFAGPDAPELSVREIGDRVIRFAAAGLRA